MECASTSGRIVYVERVDPDGDGDLHVVVTDRRSVTLRGLTAIDVSKDLPARACKTAFRASRRRGRARRRRARTC